MDPFLNELFNKTVILSYYSVESLAFCVKASNECMMMIFGAPGQLHTQHIYNYNHWYYQQKNVC